MMHQWARTSAIVSTSAFALLLSLPVRATGDTVPLEVRGGTVTFEVATNVGAISVHGRSKALEGRANMSQTTDGILIEQLQASLPVKTLNTGLGLRDDHMRKHVFTTEDGQIPDLRFALDRATCPGSVQNVCRLSGELAIRGVPRPFTIELRLKREGGAFRVVADGMVKLSAYGIPQPSQLGVQTEDDVKLHLEFVARPGSNVTLSGGAQ